MMATSINVRVEDAIATISLERPRITEQMATEISGVCQWVNQNNAVRVVIFTGKGDAFCLGTEKSSDGDFEQLRVGGSLASVHKPMIASLNGDAIDQGLELALACDIRVVTETAKLGMTHLSRGLMPWDGGTQRLPRTVGWARALDMILTSRLVDAVEAGDIGLVNLVVGDSEVCRKALDMASSIAVHGPIALRYIKEAVLKGLDLTVDQGLRLEADLSVILQCTEDRTQGIRSFLDHRPINHTGQ